MSLFHSIFQIRRSRRHEEQQNASARRSEQIMRKPPRSSSQEYYNPPEQAANIPYCDQPETLKPNILKYEIILDVQHYGPDEISIKIADRHVIIEGCHDEKRDEIGWVSRKFTRRCLLPVGCNVNALESHLSPDGVLTVSVPLARPQMSNEHAAPNLLTGPVNTQADDSKADDDSAGN